MTGFDNHDELLNNQSGLLATIDSALKEFWDAMIKLEVENEVTLFSASDFGRTIPLERLPALMNLREPRRSRGHPAW